MHSCPLPAEISTGEVGGFLPSVCGAHHVHTLIWEESRLGLVSLAMLSLKFLVHVSYFGTSLTLGDTTPEQTPGIVFLCGTTLDLNAVFLSCSL